MKKCIVFFMAACLGIVSGIIAGNLYQVTDVSDNSMMPSYSEGDGLLVSRMDLPEQSDPERGDVVLFPNRVYSVTGESGVMLKRVIGVPGDRVMITGGKVYVNNRELAEKDYIFSEGIAGEMNEIHVPKGRVFVLGDNRACSTDSRSKSVGMVRTENLLGKVIYKW